MKKVVVIGGGTGTYTVLTAIKKIPGIEITAIVSSADSRGSTGVLRDEFGQLPVGDFRQCLVALAEDNNSDNTLRDLFMYRFPKGGKGLEGHNFGNLFLTALIDLLGNEELAFRKASRVLNIKGRVFPITFDDVQLAAEYEDGSIGYGEEMIDEPPENHDGKLRIKKLWVQPKGKLFKKSKIGIEDADYIILGPGDLYTSTLANFVIDEVSDYVKNSEAKIIYISNLVSKWGQTHGFKLSDYISEITNYIGKEVDYALVNNTHIPKSILERYKDEKAYAVEDDMGSDSRVVRDDFISASIIKRKKEDKVKRSLLRHDPYKLKSAFMKIIGNS